MLPDDLSPAESIQLQRLLHEVEEGAPRLGVPVESDPLPMFGGSPEQASAEMANPLPYPHAMLDLNTGYGMWRTHEFTLPEPALKRVLAIVAKRIAEDLTAEIKRLSDETK